MAHPSFFDLSELREQYRGVSVLILGAGGFVGRWVARALSACGADLTLAARDRYRAADAFRELGVAGRIEQVDLRAPSDVGHLFSTVRPAVTFNLAAYCAHPGNDDEREAELINVSLVNWITGAAATSLDRPWPGARLVHAGSAEEYGPIGGDLSEDTVPQPTTFYGRTKLAGTRTLIDMARARGLPAIVARFFIVYGFGERRGRLAPSLFDAVRTGDVLRLSAGSQRRDFTYVEDAAEGLLRLGLVRGERGAIVNVATGVARSVREFALAGADVLGLAPGQLDFGARPLHSGDVSHGDVNVDRLRALTGWAPATDPADGFRHTRAWIARSATTGRPRD